MYNVADCDDSLANTGLREWTQTNKHACNSLYIFLRAVIQILLSVDLFSKNTDRVYLAYKIKQNCNKFWEKINLHAFQFAILRKWGKYKAVH